jgi:hypothetical protein
MAKYDIVEPDEWIRPVMNGYKMACCDCGLVHTIDFKIEEDRVWIKATRDKRATGQIRRSKKLVELTCNDTK